MAFDALKGLKEALREREERHLREEKRELSEETAAEINAQLQKLARGDEAEVRCFRAYHERTVCGVVTKIDYTFKFLTVGDERIYFDDIYSIKIDRRRE